MSSVLSGPVVFGVCQCSLSLSCPHQPSGTGILGAGVRLSVCSVSRQQPQESQAEDGTDVALCLFLCLLVLMQLDRERSGAGQDRRDSFSNVTKLKIAFGSVTNVEHFIQIGFFFCKIVSDLGIFIHIIKLYILAHV